MENPLGMGEVIVGGLTGLAGFAVAEVVDRFLATHALTDTGNKNSAGVELWTDPGDTNGHWNSTNILAPMSIGRWAAGLGLGLVPIFGAGVFKGPKARAALGFFGFGALVRTLGKGASDGIAYLTRNTGVGQRLFILEDQAQAATLTSYDANPPGIAPGPTGLKGLPAVGCGACPNCVTGVGACCGGCAQTYQPGPSGPSNPAAMTMMAPVPAQPSGPPPAAAQPPPPPPPPAQTANTAPPVSNRGAPGTTIVGDNGKPITLSGRSGRAFPPAPRMPQSGNTNFIGARVVPGVGGAPARGVYNWGSDDD
jgi:hypothetical protein